MRCHDCREQLVPYVESLVDAETVGAIHDHLTGCAACRAEEQTLRRLQGRLASAGVASKVVSLEEGVMGEIRRRQAEVLPSRPDHERARRSSRAIAVRFAVAACLTIGVGAALVAWLSRPDRESPAPRSLNHVAVEGGDGTRHGGSRFEAALEALIAADGDDDEVLNQGLQVCWSEYANDVGDGSSLQ